MTKARSNATANAAKGDLTVGSGTNLSSVLGVGSNGDTIVADSSTATGLRYTAGNVNQNPVLNSSMQVWQRGTSFATNAPTYTGDRWVGYRGTTGQTVSRQLTSDTTNLPFIQYCTRVQRDSGNTSTASLQIGQMFETVNSLFYAGKTVTLSFYGRRGANYSTASNSLDYYIVTGTGTDQNYYVGYTAPAFSGNTATLTTTWQRFSATFTLSSSLTEMAIIYAASPTGTAGAADFFEFTGVQIDVGSVALPFRTYAETIQGELAACQRYYEQSYPDGTAAGTASVLTNAEFLFSTTNIGNGNTVKNCNYAVTKRGTPTITIYGYQGGSGKVSNANGIDLAANSGIASGIGTKRFYAYNNSGADIATALNGFIFHWVASAEL